jgi:hypothetical protein
MQIRTNFKLWNSPLKHHRSLRKEKLIASIHFHWPHLPSSWTFVPCICLYTMWDTPLLSYKYGCNVSVMLKSILHVIIMAYCTTFLEKIGMACMLGILAFLNSLWSTKSIQIAEYYVFIFVWDICAYTYFRTTITRPYSVWQSAILFYHCYLLIFRFLVMSVLFTVWQIQNLGLLCSRLLNWFLDLNFIESCIAVGADVP